MVPEITQTLLTSAAPAPATMERGASSNDDGARASAATACAQVALRLRGGGQSARRHLLAQNYEIEKTAKPHNAAIYFDPERLYMQLAAGPEGRLAPVRLLKGSRLLMRAKRLEECTTEEERQRWRLPRREELVEADLLTPQEVQALPRGHVGQPFETCCPNEQTLKDKPLRLISISHGWLTTDHPDPSGQQLEKLPLRR
eukprot:221454-Prymnesium_polylepis.1